MSERALEILLRDCLSAADDDNVLIIFDESMESFWRPLINVVSRHRLSATFLQLPVQYQNALISRSQDERRDGSYHTVALPAGLIAAITESTIIITALTSDLSTGPVRRAIVKQPRNRDCRLAHMPGFSAMVLDLLVDSPIELISTNCERVAWALGEARNAVLITRDTNGSRHELKMEMGGWANDPLMSSAVIEKDSWGNLPSGESFCCPEYTTVSGEVCINGSLPDLPLESDSEVVLHFEHGLLTRWSAAQNSRAFEFFQKQEHEATRRGDRNWNVFAELGVGLNPAVTHLTGNPTFDEKALGTIHVAIGDNSAFGHRVKADIHADMVIWCPTLLLDGIEIISEGKLNEGTIDAWRQAQEGKIEPVDLERLRAVMIYHATVAVNAQGSAMRRLRRGGRLGYVRLADTTTSCQLGLLIESMPKDNWVGKEELLSLAEEECQINVTRLAQLLGILQHYAVLAVRN